MWRTLNGLGQRLSGLSLLFLVLTSSLTLNIFLGWQVRALRARVKPLRNAGVQINAVLPSLPGYDADGGATWVDFRDGKPKIVYVLSPTCGWCKRNYANIVALANQKSNEYGFVGLSIYGDKSVLKSYLSATSYPFRVVGVFSNDVSRGLGLFDETPQMIFVRGDGHVERVWAGAPDAAKQKEIETFFSAKLPGLTEPSPPPH